MPKDTTPIDADQARGLLGSDPQEPQDLPGGQQDARSEPRYSYYKIIGLLVEIHDGPAPSYYRIGTRNVSRHGMGFLHDQPLAEGTKCSAYLLTVQGEYVKCSGVVARCDLVPEGGTFEVGIRFTEPLAIERFTFAE